jgi:hypothetical protein
MPILTAKKGPQMFLPTLFDQLRIDHIYLIPLLPKQPMNIVHEYPMIH